MDNELKALLLKLALTAGHDLGGKSVQHYSNMMANGEEIDSTDDHITAIIYNGIRDADNLKDARDNLNYASRQLQAAVEKL